jgi:lysophospholipase L1-like esterase
MIRERLCIGVFLLLVMSTTGIEGQELALHEGDRVVFYGDSITAQRLYTRFAEDFVLTRYPQMHISFWNSGVPGDTVDGGYTGNMPTRLKRDVVPHQPTVVTIMLGMNDGYYMDFNPKYLDVFKGGYSKLLDGLQGETPSPRITLISPTPYDEVTHGTEFAHYNETVSHYSSAVKELAASSHFGLSDFNKVETDLLNAGLRKNKSLAALLILDRIHPAEASHWVLAAALARSWGVSPIVSNVRLDAALGKTLTAENTQVSDLKVSDGRLGWTQTDNALPLPLPLDDGMIQYVLSISDLADMDRQLLCVKSLQAARYTLKIDGKKISSFTREQLSTGVNLALYATPMESQAKDVDGIELKRARLDEAHFIIAIENPKIANDADATRAIAAKDAALAAEQRETAQPKPHQFELSPE